MLLEDIHHDKQILFEEHVADGLTVRSPLLIRWHSIKGAYKEAGAKDTILHGSFLNNFAASPYVNVLNDIGVHDKGRQDAAVVDGDHWVLFGIKFGLFGRPTFLVKEFEGECETCRLDITRQYSLSSLCCDGSRCTDQKGVIPRITLNALRS